jgi:DNA-binding ferritin-like protein (Dps family)
MFNIYGKVYTERQKKRRNQKMKTLKELRKYMYDNREAIDFEEGEMFSDWWEAYEDALIESDQIVVINGKTYVKD